MDLLSSFSENAGKYSDNRSKSVCHILNLNIQRNQLRCIFGDDLNNSQLKILYILICDPESSAEQMSDLIGKTKRSIEYNLQQLKNKEILIRHGADKNGYWEVAKSQFPCENTQENAEQFNLSQK